MDKLDGKTERECRIEGRWGLLAMPAHTRSRCWDQCLPHRSSEGQRSGTTLVDGRMRAPRTRGRRSTRSTRNSNTAACVFELRPGSPPHVAIVADIGFGDSTDPG